MTLIYITYSILLTSIISLWAPIKSRCDIWKVLLALSLLFALITHIATLTAILSLVIFYILVKLYIKFNPRYKVIPGVTIFILGLSLELHLVPGFHNLLIINKTQITPSAVPYTLYLNFDKSIVGLIILGLTLNLAKTLKEWKCLLKCLKYYLPLTLLIILALSFQFHYIKFEPKLPPYLSIWIISNLFFTCLAEEALFRGFIQNSLSKFNYKYSQNIALLISALLFGLIHYRGGIKYVILATIAGFLYGFIYKVSKRIEASILAHFILNLIHILLFTYPALR